ncbi:MAG TPA: hypothetical protein VMT00_14840 [Thermoanaerobaculia bacterium]|nr:hypothetical protein [Thermoanaerobaculia bacterium]
MTQVQLIQRVVVVSVALLFVAPMSMIAEDRPQMETALHLSDVRDQRSGRTDLDGVVVSVARNGNSFVLRNGRTTHRIDARGNVPVHFLGRRYRVRDLEPGDRVAIDLVSRSNRQLRARAVHVLQSISHRRPDDRRYHRGRYDRFEGRVISLDLRRNLLVVRTDARRDVRIDTRQLDTRGSRSLRSIRIGDAVVLAGFFSGSTFVAESLVTKNDRYGRR